jgi:lysophospholipase L1-like esterase
MIWFKRFGLALFATAAFLAAAEALARLRFRPEKIEHQGPFEYDRDKIYRLKPNYTGEFARRPVKTNRFGHRDDPLDLRKPAGVVRILAVGDSVTFGHGVDARESFPERLESLFNQCAPGRRFEVINTAVPGNSPFQEYVDLTRGFRFQPDAVILQFTLNDVVEPYQVFRRFGGVGRDYHGVEDVSYVHYLLSQRSGLYLFLQEVWNRVRLRDPGGTRLPQKAWQREEYMIRKLFDEPDSPPIREAWAECLKWMGRMAEACRKRAIPLVLVLTPSEIQLGQPPDAALPQIRMRDFAEQQGLPCLDVLERIRAEVGSPEDVPVVWRKYFLDYGHFNAAGHQFVADALYPVLRERLVQRGALPAD